MARLRRPKKNRQKEFWVSFKTFELIQNGEKDLLVRSEYWIFSKAMVDEIVLIRAVNRKGEFRCARRIVARRCYRQMTDVVDHENLQRMAHGDKHQTLLYLGRIYQPDQQEAEAVVYELAQLEEEPS